MTYIHVIYEVQCMSSSKQMYHIIITNVINIYFVRFQPIGRQYIVYLIITFY